MEDSSLSPTRNVLITGANTGIGYVTAERLLARGFRVFIACRSTSAGEEAVARMRGTTGQVPTLLSLDLGDLASVHACAEQFQRQGLPLHVLINNAGLAGKRAMTKSGFELAFGVNHVGHFLLTKLLMPQLTAAGDARVVNVSSKAHYRAKAIDWDAVRRKTKSITGLREYQVSKLANVLFTRELARRIAGTGITTYALHPGVVASDAWRQIPQPVRWLMVRPMISVEAGALTTLHCATAPGLASESGLYYDKQAPKEPSRLAQDPELAAELWRRSEAWVA